MKKFFTFALASFGCLVIFGALFVFTVAPDTSVESIGYQYAIREDVATLPSLATPAGYTSLNTQSFFSGRETIKKLAKSIVEGQTTDMGKANSLLYWVQLHVRPQTSAPTVVITDDYVNIIKRGWGYCDQMAHVFATMATYVGLEAKQLQLFNSEGISPHTAAMVKIDGKWRIVSVWRGVIPTNSKNEAYTLTGLVKLLQKKDSYEFASGGITAYEFRNSKTYSTYPYTSNLQVVLKVSKRLSAKTKLIYKSFFSSPLPSPLLTQSPTIQKIEVPDKYLKLYDQARIAHINLDYRLAEKLYKKVIIETNSEVLRNQARFQDAMALFDSKNYPGALKGFNKVIQTKPLSAWHISAQRMAAETLLKLGDTQASLVVLDSIKTIQSKVRAQQIRTEAAF